MQCQSLSTAIRIPLLFFSSRSLIKSLLFILLNLVTLLYLSCFTAMLGIKCVKKKEGKRNLSLSEKQLNLGVEQGETLHKDIIL